MIFSKDISIKLLNNLLIELEQIDLFPVIGYELEFYLTDPNHSFQNNLWQAPKLEVDINIDKEAGINQFEFRTIQSKNILSSINNLITSKNKIILQAEKQGLLANFSAKPIDNQPGNAMHIHLHLENADGENLYRKKNKEEESDIFLYSIAGLCSTMQENMLLFAPNERSYLRYSGNSLQSPSKICWGGNNRSAAIRVPINQDFNRRLEHRVASSDSCPFEVVIAILYGIIKGIKEKEIPSKKLHGNAFLEQYDYPLLPENITEAQEFFKHSTLKNTFYHLLSKPSLF